jgi:hypothetical protein
LQEGDEGADGAEDEDDHDFLVMDNVGGALRSWGMWWHLDRVL